MLIYWYAEGIYLGDMNRKPHSEETKIKIGNALRGRKLSEETKVKIGKFHKGKIISQETRRKISEALRGCEVSWTGKPLSEEQKEKISKSKFKVGWRGYWARQAKIRDNYTCQICGLKDLEIMEVDHIKPRSKYPELGGILSNMMTLCPNCHRRKTNKELKHKLYD